jgi:AcrR family transcriptional regulator
MSKGAIYSNFSGKAELLLAAMMARGLTVEAAPAPAGATLAEHVRGLAEALAATVRRAQGEQALLADFQVYALGDAELRAGLAEVYGAAFGETAAFLAAMPGGGDPAAARRLAVALQSIALGFVVQAMITPAEVTPEVIGETLQAFAVGLERRGD